MARCQRCNQRGRVAAGGSALGSFTWVCLAAKSAGLDRAVQQQCQARQANQCLHGQGCARDTVDTAVQGQILFELRTVKLVSESGVFDFPSTTLTIDKHAHFGELMGIDDQACSDGLFFTDVVEQPRSAFAT